MGGVVLGGNNIWTVASGKILTVSAPVTAGTSSLAKPATRQTDDDLLITEATRRQLSDDLGGWDERPPIALKGKAQEVRLYGSRALSAAGLADGPRDHRAGGERPFY